MPNSGTVTAGSVALASQYNNLRSDVLDASTGHTHTGAAEDGKRIEGTAIASTGVTAGYVLTAGAGGTATTWAAPATAAAVGALGSATVNLAWSAQTFTDPTYEVTYQSGLSGGAKWTFSGGGTQIYAVQRVSSTSAPTLQRYVLGSNTVASSTAIASLIVAGTVQRVEPMGYGFNSGTAVLLAETVAASTSGNRAVTLRKFNQTLTSNMWNTTVVSGIPSAAVSVLPFYSSNCKYEPSIGIWYSYDGYLSSGNYTAVVYVVNDVSGSVYTASFGTTSTNQKCEIVAAQYVPSAGAGNGTIYAWGSVVDAGGTINYRRVAYEVGSASITATGTVTQTLGYPALYRGHRPTIETGSEIPGVTFWDAANTAIVMKTIVNQAENSGPAFVGLDRTAETVLFRSMVTSGTVSRIMALGAEFNPMQPFDPVTRLYGDGANNFISVFALGAVGDMYGPTYYVNKASSTAALSQANGFPVMVGPGSATDMCWTTDANGTSMKSQRMVEQWLSVEVLAASTVGRIVWYDPSSAANQFPAAVRASNASPFTGLGFQYRSNSNVLSPMDNPSFPLYLPANAAMTAVFSRQSYFTGSFAGATIVAAMTATFKVRTLSLS